MIKFLISLILNGITVMLVAYLMRPMVFVDGLLAAITVGVILGILNTVLRPIFLLFTLPLNLATLGLFTFIINGAIVLLASRLIAGFEVKGIFYAIIFSLILSIVNGIKDFFFE